MASKNEREAARLGISLQEFKKLKKKGKTYQASRAYKSLSDDEKKLADLQYDIQVGTSEFSSKQLKEALKKAKKDSKGFLKGVLRVFENEVSQQVAQETGDFQSHLDTLNENIKEINEDLATNKEFLTLEEQRTLASQSREYEQARGTLETQIAGTGTTFSTIGEQKREFAEETQKGIVEGTTARFDKQIADLETSAARGNIRAQQQLKDIRRGFGENIQAIGTKAEEFLGTKRVKELGIEGFKPLGDISGTFKEEQVKDIEERRKAFLAEERQESLQF